MSEWISARQESIHTKKKEVNAYAALCINNAQLAYAGIKRSQKKKITDEETIEIIHFTRCVYNLCVCAWVCVILYLFVIKKKELKQIKSRREKFYKNRHSESPTWKNYRFNIKRAHRSYVVRWRARAFAYITIEHTQTFKFIM